MTRPDSLERPIVSGSVPSGSSSPAFGPLVMTMLETVSVVAFFPFPPRAGAAGALGGTGAVAARGAGEAVAFAGTGCGSLRTRTPKRSARRA